MRGWGGANATDQVSELREGTTQYKCRTLPSKKRKEWWARRRTGVHFEDAQYIVPKPEHRVLIWARGAPDLGLRRERGDHPSCEASAALSPANDAAPECSLHNRGERKCDDQDRTECASDREDEVERVACCRASIAEATTHCIVTKRARRTECTLVPNVTFERAPRDASFAALYRRDYVWDQ